MIINGDDAVITFYTVLGNTSMLHTRTININPLSNGIATDRDDVVALKC